MNDTLSGNPSGGNHMVMLQTDEVLQGEGDSNSQVIQDSNFGGVLAGWGFYLYIYFHTRLLSVVYSIVLI